jgi:hypothetical protein
MGGPSTKNLKVASKKKKKVLSVKGKERQATSTATAAKQGKKQQEEQGDQDQAGSSSGDEEEAKGNTSSQEDGDGDGDSDQERDRDEEPVSRRSVDVLEQLLAEMAALREEVREVKEEKERSKQQPQLNSKRQLFSGSPMIPTSGGLTRASTSAAAELTAGTAVVVSRLPELRETREFFGGDMDSDALDGWVSNRMRDIRYYRLGGQLQTQEQQVHWLVAHLSGAAMDWWNSTAEPSGRVTTVAEFLQELNTRFRSRLDGDVAADKLMNLCQGLQQPVAQYVSVVQGLLVRLPEMDSRTRIRMFAHGLLPHLAQKVREHEPDTVEEAFEIAIRYEGSFVGLKNKSGGGGGAKPSGQGGKGGAGVGLNAVGVEEQGQDDDLGTAILAALRRAGVAGTASGRPAWQQPRPVSGTPAAPGGSTGGQLRCYRCGRRGHAKWDCTEKENVCYGCGKPGHIRQDCPERKTRWGSGAEGAGAGQGK